MRKAITLLLLLVSLSTFARFISKDSCVTIARNAFYEKTFRKPSTTKVVNLYKTKPNGKKFLFGYVVNFAGGGWIAIQNQNTIRPVFAWWGADELDPSILREDNPLYMYFQQRGEITEAAATLKESHTQEWERLASASQPMVRANAASIPKLTKSSYGQDPYVNDSCPRNNYGLAVVGCGAQSMVCIFRYWGYAKGAGSYTYTPYGYTSQSVNFANANYDFSKIPYTNSKSPELAQLMYHAGVSVGMQYGSANTGGSGCYTDGNISCRTAYSKYFGYKPVNCVYQKNYTTDAWIELMKTELSAGRVIQYFGYDPSNAGHTFCLVGYDNNGLFTVDWGWNNYGNGNFSLNKLAVSGYDFAYNAGALTGIEPAGPYTPPAPPITPPVVPPAPIFCDTVKNMRYTSTATTATVMWDKGTNDSIYSVWQQIGGSKRISTAATNSNTFYDFVSTNFTVSIQKICKGGVRGAYNTPIKVVIGTTPPPVPPTPTCAPTSGLTAKPTTVLNWAAVSGASGYNVVYVAEGISQAATTAANTLTVSGCVTSYKVQVICTNGVSSTWISYP